MIATLRKEGEINGFSHNKDYKYSDQYNVGNAELKFYFESDDNGRRRILNQREFETNFYGGYERIEVVD